MDIRKILKNINIIIKIEDKYSLIQSIQNILSYLLSNQIEELKNEKNDLYKNLENSEIDNFINSDLKILDLFKCRKFFSLELKETIEDILSLNSYEIQGALEELINNRANKLSQLRNLQNQLNQLEIKEENHSQSYQIVFSFGDNYHKFNDLTIVTKDINNFLNALNANCQNKDNFKINSVNNGCIEFFIEIIPELASYAEKIIDYILKVFKAIKVYQNIKEGFKDFKEARRKKLEDLAKEELNDKKKENLDELMNKLNIKDEESINKFKKHIEIMLKHFEKGVLTEIKPPLIEEKPQEISDEDEDEIKTQKQEAKDKYLTRISEIKKINKLNKELLEVKRSDFKLFLTEDNNDDKEKENQNNEN